MEGKTRVEPLFECRFYVQSQKKKKNCWSMHLCRFYVHFVLFPRLFEHLAEAKFHNFMHQIVQRITWERINLTVIGYKIKRATKT